MITFITPKLKDDLLADLLSVESMGVQNNVHSCAKEFDTSSDIIEGYMINLRKWAYSNKLNV